MSFSKILEELPHLSPEERLRIAEEARALDAPSAKDEAVAGPQPSDQGDGPETAFPRDWLEAFLVKNFAMSNLQIDKLYLFAGLVNILMGFLLTIFSKNLWDKPGACFELACGGFLVARSLRSFSREYTSSQ